MSARGHWLEAACEASLETLRRAGTTCVQKIAIPSGMTRDGNFYQRRSTVDYVGVHNGIAVAFDAKATREPALPSKNVHKHQLEFLRAFQTAGGLGALLVAFDGRGEGSFLCSVDWYDQVTQELSYRNSIPHKRFVVGALKLDEDCVALQHGQNGLPIPLDQGFSQLMSMRYRHEADANT